MTFDGRRPSVEDDLLWKTTFVGRQPIVEDYLQWQTTFSGRRPSLDPCMLPTPLCGIFLLYELIFVHSKMNDITWYHVVIFFKSLDFYLFLKTTPKPHNRNQIKQIRQWRWLQGIHIDSLGLSLNSLLDTTHHHYRNFSLVERGTTTNRSMM